jgi:MoxR-like ATPase
MVSTQEAVFRASIAANVPVFLKGDSGIGKSAFIRDYATASRRHLESVVLAHKEKSDIGGIPTVREGAITTTEFAVPGWGHRLVEADKGLLLLSEFNMGEVDVQQACMNVLQERQVGENTYLPESVAIVLDGNPPERYATSSDLPSQIANRLLHLDWELDRQAWLDGMTSGWPTGNERIIDDGDARTDRVAREKSLVLAFLDAHRPYIHDQPTDPAHEGGAWPSPRSWDNAIQVLSRIDEDATDVQTATLRGLVGRAAAEAFMRWRIEAADFDLRAVLDDPTVEDWSDHHPSKTLTVLGAVSTFAVEQGSLDVWRDALAVLMHCAEVTGRKDVCLRSARLLLSRAPKGAKIPASAEETFGPMLRSIGAWR